MTDQARFAHNDLGLLWHYTSAATLPFILRSVQDGEAPTKDATLRAHKVSDMNDTSELTWGLNELNRSCSMRYSSLFRGCPTPGTSKGLLKLTEWGKRFGGTGEPIPLPECYVACLSDAGDLLSQWRGYAHDDGVAIGFERDTLKNLQVSGQTVSPRAVQYVGPVLGGRGRGDDPFREHWEGTSAEDGEGIDAAIEGAILDLGLIKHFGFQEEQESRLMLVNPDRRSVSVETAGGRLRAFVTVDLPLGSIRAVRVGPGRNMAHRLDMVRMLLEDRGFEAHQYFHEGPVSVGSSVIPYQA